MKRALSRLIFADCLFVLFLSLASLVGGTLEWPIYAAAFIVPTLIILAFPREEDFKISIFSRSSFSALAVSSVFPIIFAIFVISFLTSLVMGAVGIEATVTDTSGNLLYVILVSAFAPAVFEEMLFRYLPARLLGGYSNRLTVIYSTILFALAHCNAFQIPYALIAGALFMALDIATGSIFPSVAVHFINNILSILWQREGSENSIFCVIFIISLLVLTAVSLFVVYIKRKEIKNELRPILEDKSKFEFTYQLGFYIIVMIFLSVSTYIM